MNLHEPLKQGSVGSSSGTPEGAVDVPGVWGGPLRWAPFFGVPRWGSSRTTPSGVTFLAK